MYPFQVCINGAVIFEVMGERSNKNLELDWSIFGNFNVRGRNISFFLIALRWVEIAYKSQKVT